MNYSRKIENEEIKKTMKLSIKEGVAYSISIGAGNNYITPYALSFNATNGQIAMLSSIPNLLNSIFQMFTPKLMNKYSRKKIVVSSVFIQALLWIPIIFLSLLYLKYKTISVPYMLIILVTLYTIMNSFISPAWRSWISDIIPDNIRGFFFGMRSKFATIAEITTMIIAGFILDKTKFFGIEKERFKMVIWK